MSPSEEKNVAMVRELFAAFTRGDMASVMAAIADDVEWFMPDPPEMLPFAGLRRGREEVMQCFVSMNETLEFELFQPDEFLACDDKVIVLGRTRDRMRKTGRVAENEWASFLTMRDGKVSRYRIFEDTAALVAALQ